MSLASLRQELHSRGGEAPIWLVFLDDAVAQVQGESGSLLLHRAFWTRGEAYAYAQRLHRERAWQHFSVCMVMASADAAADKTRLYQKSRAISNATGDGIKWPHCSTSALRLQAD
jgi:hypothetical protein